MAKPTEDQVVEDMARAMAQADGYDPDGPCDMYPTLDGSGHIVTQQRKRWEWYAADALRIYRANEATKGNN